MKPDDDALELAHLSAEEAPELHRALGSVKQQLPSAGELAALSASLSSLGLPVSDTPALGANGATGATASGASSKLPFAKLWVVLGGAAVVGAIWWMLPVRRVQAPVSNTTPSAAGEPDRLPNRQAKPAADRDPSTPSRGTANDSSVAKRELLSPTALPTPSTAETSIDGPKPNPALADPIPSPRPALESAIAPARSQAKSQASSSSSAVGSNAEVGAKAKPSEIELLRDARLALASSPNLALGLTDQHAALYPAGKMTQERELIAISALVRLGRHAAVLSRAQRFERDFPNSPYRQQIAQMAQ